MVVLSVFTGHFGGLPTILLNFKDGGYPSLAVARLPFTALIHYPTIMNKYAVETGFEPGSEHLGAGPHTGRP